MAFERLNYEKSWENPGDFPTYEDSEAQVRADLQYHPDAIREFINEKLAAALESEEGAALVGASGGSVQGVLDGAARCTVQDILDTYLARFERVDDDIRLVAAGGEPGTGRAVSAFYRVFEPGEWSGGVLRLPKAEHGMSPKQPACVCELRMRVGRNARDYLDGTHVNEVRTALIGIEAAALAANTAAPGTYPVNGEDGHVPLSWEQVQFYILEGTLAGEAAAAAAAVEKGFNWRERDTLGVEETVSLDALLTAAYLPAIGAPATQLDALFSLEAVQGLRFRRRQEDVPAEGAPERYDLDGTFMHTWGTQATRARWDVAAEELVIEAEAAYPGDITVMG